MARVHPLHIVPALLVAAHAGEITVEPSPFFLTQQFEAIVIPVDVTPVLGIDGLVVARIAPHGTRAAAGDSLLRFDPGHLERAIQKAQLALRSEELAITKAETALRHLSESGPVKLAGLKLTAREAKENLDDFNANGRKAAEERALQALRSANQFLSQQREELARLDKIHEPGKAPDKPEPLPIVRQRDVIASAEFALHMETLDQERRLKVLIPREAEALAIREKETLLAFHLAEESLQKELSFRQTELEISRAGADISKRELTALEARRQLLEFKAPAPGWWFHGNLHGAPAKGEIPVATFVPATSKTILVARVPGETARSLPKDLEGSGSFSGAIDPAIPLKITSIAEAPDTDGLHRVEISATWPEGHQPVPGGTYEARFVSHRKPSAISIPNRALTFGPDGWTVNVKLADGKAEPRSVKPGLVSIAVTEILSGLESGQVIIVPGESR